MGAAVAFACACALVPALALAGPGDLDRTFGTRGQVMAPFGSAPRDLLLLPGGRFLVAGGRVCPDRECGLNITRFNANGKIDRSFGSNGRVDSPVPGVAGISKLVRQPDGKLVAVGDAAGQDAWLVARYNPDGTLDTSFGSGGVTVTHRAQNGTFAADVIVTADGKLAVAGMVDGEFALARYNRDGSLDGGFGDGGEVVTPVGASGSFAHAVVELPDGRLVAAGGATPGDFGSQVHDALVRYNPDGSLDQSFGTHGQTAGPPGYTNVLVRQPDGKLIAAGSRVTRYNGDGLVDTAFVAGADPGIVGDVLLQPDGKLVVVGHWRTLYSGLWLVRRLEPNGATDPGFCLPPKPLKGEAYAAALRRDGTLLVAGEGNVPGSGYLIRRYRGDGSGHCADTTAPVTTLRMRRLRLARLLTKRVATSVAVTKHRTADRLGR